MSPFLLSTKKKKKKISLIFMTCTHQIQLVEQSDLKLPTAFYYVTMEYALKTV